MKTAPIVYSGLQWLSVATKSCQWLLVVPNGHLRLPVVSNGNKWLPIATCCPNCPKWPIDEYQWSPMATSGYQWLLIAIGHQWLPVVTKGYKCSPLDASGSLSCQKNTVEITISYNIYRRLSLSQKSRGPDKILQVISSLR